MRNIKIINKKPKEYLPQGLRYCSGFTIKGILSAYNLDDGRSPREYLGFFSIASPKFIKKILEKYGFSCQIKKAINFSYKDKIRLLKKELNKDHPVILLIGNGYSHNGKYSWIRQQLIPHWITIYGYNDKEKVFYIYDSFFHSRSKTPTESFEKPQNSKLSKKNFDAISFGNGGHSKSSIGNVKRTYKQLLRDWEGAIFTRKYIYISLIRNK